MARTEGLNEARGAAPGTGVAADARSLDALRRSARDDPRAAARAAATQFEALFVQSLLKQMREAMPKSGLLDSDAQASYTQMLDQQLAQQIAGRGTGLAAAIARQLERSLPAQPASGGTGAAAPGLAASPTAAAGAAAAAGGDRVPRPGRLPAAAAFAGVPAAATLAGPATSGAGAGAAAAEGGTAVQQAFVTRHAAHAAAAERATGIPARFVLGQAALESGWGRYELRGTDGRASHNLFGIKAGRGWTGATVDVATTEYEAGVPQRRVERFRAYASYEEAFTDWARLIGGQPRYAAVLQGGTSDEGFAHGLQRAGYATDPAYADKLLGVIRSTRALAAQVGAAPAAGASAAPGPAPAAGAAAGLAAAARTWSAAAALAALDPDPAADGG